MHVWVEELRAALEASGGLDGADLPTTELPPPKAFDHAIRL